MGQSKEIRPLTGLRGVAAVLVVLYHAVPISLPPSSGPPALIHHGYLWVDLFFVLSGFVIGLAFGDMFVGKRWSWTVMGRFLQRRLARIYPLYFALTSISAIVILLRHPDFPSLGTTILANLMMVQAWGIAPSVDPPAWSISTEWAAYLLFPALAAFVARPGRLGPWCLGVLAIVTVCAVAQAGADPLNTWSEASSRPLWRCLAEFSFGLLAFRLYGQTAARRFASSTIVTSLVLAAILTLMAVPNTDIAVVAFFPALVLCMACGDGKLHRLFGSSLPYHAGVISYSIYLVHARFLFVDDHAIASLSRVLPPPVAEAGGVATFLGCVWAASEITYRLIEQPGRRLIAGGGGGDRRPASGPCTPL